MHELVGPYGEPWKTATLKVVQDEVDETIPSIDPLRLRIAQCVSAHSFRREIRLQREVALQVPSLRVPAVHWPRRNDWIHVRLGHRAISTNVGSRDEDALANLRATTQMRRQQVR